ncbi:MAG: pyruvate, phosphate dikinase [Eubacteriaceae bacterium]|nr:pyruvate, phosphate dikinase [Eubacteriaceae bacterium]
MDKKWVYMFSEGDTTMRNLLGGKGSNLAEMTKIGLPVPQGYTVTTEACIEYLKDTQLTDGMISQIDANMKTLEEICNKKFGDPQDPLLVSVRSGAKFSMPGMMDTILNLGLNDVSVRGVVANTQNERFALDAYRRFIQMFGDVVLEIEHAKFEDVLDEIKNREGYEDETQLTVENLKEVVQRYKEIYLQETGNEFPQDPNEQLLMAVEAVFKSWNNNRARVYREKNNIPHDIGTAVNVQAMVFGNMGNDSGTGVAFTRNPATGENKLFGEFLINAQGEDVVAGIRTPKDIEELKDEMPDVYKEFHETSELLEKHYREMQDVEFTIEKNKLYMLQTRSGKRTAEAAIKIAVDMVKEGLITEEEALTRIEPTSLDQLLHPTFDPKALEEKEILATGLPASPGAAKGRVYFNAEDAKNAADKGEDVILVRKETSPEDIEGMYAAKGILTSTGGMTSHAAVVARGAGICCVAGCEDAKVFEDKKYFQVGDIVIKEGDDISLHGTTGDVFQGSIKTQDPVLSEDFGELMKWAVKYKTMGVYANADTPHDAATALEFGAEGIGLCRTEHMFFDEDRISSMRRMILSQTVEQRENYLAELLPMQREDFVGIFEIMLHRPVTVRLLDPPLHEFLPTKASDIEQLAADMGYTIDQLESYIRDLEEFNPMLGHRGCRLAVTYPEIAVMQTRAIIEAAIEVTKKTGVDIVPEIMIPLISMKPEMDYVYNVIKETAEKVISEKQATLNYHIGTMIEIPRATLVADKIAETAEFFSFGTNDLTQMTYGFSRDDAAKYIEDYTEKEILTSDPFASIDQEGVGQLVRIGVERGRKTKPNLKVGVCGEHGGDPASVQFFYDCDLTYVSCSPFRVPLAALAAAQAAINDK